MLVPREHLPNAISLNTIMFQTASVVGPSLGGILIAATGVGWAYALNAVSFLFVIAALLMMRDVPERRHGRPDRETTCRCARPSKGCASCSGRRSSARRCCWISSRRSFRRRPRCCRSSRRTSCASAPQGYGWLYAAPAVGAVVTSAAMVPLTERIERRGPTLLWAVAGYGLATVVFGSRASFWLTFVCLALTGATDTVSMVIRNIIRQLETPDRLRGRMTGVNMVFFMGGPQLGELEAGAVANWLGAPFSVISGGIGCLIATAWVAASNAGAAALPARSALRSRRERERRRRRQRFTQSSGATEKKQRRLVFAQLNSSLLLCCSA